MYVQNGARVPQNLHLIALDGFPIPDAAVTAPVIRTLIPPGGRAEFIVTTPPAGAFAQLVTRAYDTGKDGARNPGRVIANIVSSATAAQAPLIASAGDAAAISPKPLPPPTRRRKLYFSENRQDLKDPAKPAQYFVTVEGKTPKVFDMRSTRPDITVAQGSVEDWTIENRATEAHVFHIHQLHFQVVQRDGRKVDEPAFRDTIDLPPWDGESTAWPAVTLRMDFRDPAIAGTFIYHCHILEHEDAGMMGSLRVVARH
jgi:FtsP/CotA-like multicopper oxidase with cupredoxin domain